MGGCGGGEHREHSSALHCSVLYHTTHSHPSLRLTLVRDCTGSLHMRHFLTRGRGRWGGGGGGSTGSIPLHYTALYYTTPHTHIPPSPPPPHPPPLTLVRDCTGSLHMRHFLTRGKGGSGGGGGAQGAFLCTPLLCTIPHHTLTSLPPSLSPWCETAQALYT